MSQWGQPGFQYPMQTGFPAVAQPQHQQFQPTQQLNQNPQFQQPHGGFVGNPGVPSLTSGLGGLAPQPTGFPTRPQGFQQPQQTGFPGAQGLNAGFLQAQPTGFAGAPSNFQQRPPPPPVPPLPSQYQHSAPPPPPPIHHQQPTFLNANHSRLGGPSTASFGTPSLVTQPTGFAGRTPAPLVPQVTGFVDPRLQMMSSLFMPANISAPYTSGGAPQLAPAPQQQLGGLSLQQSFQQHNQAHGRGNAPKIPWALSKEEKKKYDQVFRGWDAQGTGFISGQTALEVFGQSGLDRNDLARIWTLADADNRGKINLAEFHVAMGLIFRRLQGNDVPDELPAELVPPSSRDLDTSVNFLKDILKNDTRARSPSGIDGPVSYLKDRSLTSASSFTQRGGRQDATVYKHEDAEPPGGFYQPRNRHVDRSAVRSRADDASPATADLSSIKRQLLNTQKMLDDTLANERSSDALDRELEDLRYRITRLQDDLEYISKGPRSTAKDEERRRLERELVRLMHEEVPELEKQLGEREARREREKREWTRDRDTRNERFGRYGGDDGGRYSPASSRYREEEERPYSRGASRYDQDDRDRRSDGRGARDGQDRDRRSSPSARTRTPPAAPPVPPANSIAPPPAPPAPSRSPAPAMKNMTPEERQAYIRAEAQRRLEARKQALGVVAPSAAGTASPALDTTIETRLAEEKKEAEERARDAERQAEEREKQRREKLEAEKALKEGKSVTLTPTTTATAPSPAPGPVPTPTVTPSKTAPPAPKSRAPAPPPPRRGGVPRAPFAAAPAQVPIPPVPPVPVPVPAAPTPVVRAPVPPPAPVEHEEDAEDAALKVRQEALRKKAEERATLMRRLEEEEEEARKAEEAYKERRNQFLAAKNAASVPPPPSPPAPPAILTPPAPLAPPVSAPVQAEEPEPEEAAPPPPPPPPPPAPAVSAPAGDKASNNPFSRRMKEGGVAAPPAPTTVAANGSSNPFFRAQPSPAPPAAPAPPKSPGIPPPVKASYHTAPKDSDDDWDDVMEKDEDESSDEELATRDTRRGLAIQLFGNLLPSRPQSAGPAPNAGSPASPAPVPPPPPSSAPPAPAPAAPSAPIVAPAPTGDINALLSAIQGGARLRKAVTNDRSGAATSGKVVGDNAPPAHVNAAARPASPPTQSDFVPAATFTLPPPPVEPPVGQNAPSHRQRESVDWYNGLAADVERKEVDRLPATVEEDEEELGSSVPVIHVSDHAPEGGSELMADIDHSIEFRVRSLYPYEGQRTEDLSFDVNTVIVAHPSKSGGDWWHGTLVKDGKTGFFPQTYVQKVEKVHATAIYAYEGTNSDDLAFAEGDVLTIIDRSEQDWWKAEREGIVFNVPATYLEVTEDDGRGLGLGLALALGLGLGLRQGQMGSEGLDGGPGRHGDDQFSTPYASPQDDRDPGVGMTPSLNGKPEQEDEDDGDDEDEDDDDDAYYSLDEGDNSDDEGGTTAEREAREIERRRILEDAGLVVNTVGSEDEDMDVRASPADVPGATVPGSIGAISESPRRQRRPAPVPPLRTSFSHLKEAKDLPPIPRIDLPHDTESDLASVLPSTATATDTDDNDRGRGHIETASEPSFNSARPNDAFERYEAFKKTQGQPDAMTLHRLNGQAHGHGHGSSPARASVSSLDAVSSFGLSSPPRSPAVSVTPSLRDRAEGGGESRTSQFLSFLGRHARSSTPDIDKERKIVISGPILQAPVPSNAGTSPGGVLPPPGGGEVSMSREDSPAFGSSWASLVDRSALEEIPKDERKRQEAIFELISTEADYVRDLQLIVELFYSRLMQILDEKATETIFSNIEDILLTNTTFLSTLEERQRDCRLYIDRIGDLLEKHMPNMRVYLNYCVNQAYAGKVLQQMREMNPDLGAQLQTLREDMSARNLDLSSYLLVPMQRLTRYPLLIRQIMRYTDPSRSGVAPESSSFWGDIAERQSITAALQTAETILEEVNETIRDQEGYERLREISRGLWIGQGRLDLTVRTRYLGPRKLLKEGVLTKTKSGRKLRVLLCSDLLVLVNEAERTLYRMPIPVNEIEILESRSGRDDHLIRIYLTYPRGGNTIVLKGSTVREAKVWKDAIVNAGLDAREGMRNVP